MKCRPLKVYRLRACFAGSCCNVGGRRWKTSMFTACRRNRLAKVNSLLRCEANREFVVFIVQVGERIVLKVVYLPLP